MNPSTPDPDQASEHGHPLPGSAEARESEIPEHLVRDKGLGDDPKERVQPRSDAVTPEGEPYPAGPGSDAPGELIEDQTEHQDRGQSAVETEGDPG